MGVIVRKRISIWLFIVILCLSSLSGFSGGNMVHAESNEPLVMESLPKFTEQDDIKAQAAPEPSANLPFPQHISDWMLDEEAGYIYAIAKATNKLYFINKQTLTIEKELLVGSMPTDMDRIGDQLFIALSGATMIQVVDLQTQTLAESYNVGNKPIQVDVTPTHIFYTVDPWYIHSYDRTTKTGTRLNFIMHDPVLQSSNDNRTIFIGRTGSTGSELIAYDYIANQKVGDSRDAGGNGFTFPYEKILKDEDSVYFGGYRINQSNLAEYHGAYIDYEGDSGSYYSGDIMDVSARYVLTSRGVFDKNTFRMLTKLPATPLTGLVDDNGTVFVIESDYYGNSQSNVLKSYTLPLIAPSSIQLDKKSTVSLLSNYQITDWATSDDIPYIYLISEQANELAIINKSDFSFIKSIWIGSRPGDVEVNGGKVYVALKGETHLVEFDVANSEKADLQLKRKLLKTLPKKIQPYQNAVVYSGYDNRIMVLTENNENKQLLDYSYYGNQYVLDPKDGFLYIAGDFYWYKMDPLTQTTVHTERITDSSYRDYILKDGDSLYYGAQRMDANDLKTVFGTYPGPAIHIKDQQVIAHTGVYDRDTYVKTMSFPFFVKKAFVENDGAAFVSTDKKLYKFTSLDAIDPYVQSTLTPSNPILLDTDVREGVIKGYIAFTPPVEQELINYYEAYFLDKDGKKLDQIRLWTNQVMADGTIVYEISSWANVPAGAVSFGVFPHLKDQAKLYEYGAVGELWDTPTYLPTNFTMIDSNSNLNTFTGTVTWTPGKKEPIDSVYEIYFINEEGPVGQPLETVEVGKTSYSISLNLNSIPEDVIGMGILIVKNNGFAPPFYVADVFKELVSQKVEPYNISIVKNRTTADTVTVYGVQPGDIIRVYNDNQSYLYAAGTVQPGSTSLLFTIHDIGYPSSKISITRETPGKFESDATVVVIPNFSGSQPPPVTPPVITPPIIVTPPVVVPPTTPEESDKLVESTIESNGKQVMVAEVSEKYAELLMKQSDFPTTKTLVLKTEKQESNVHFKLSEKAVKAIVNKNKSAFVEIHSTGGSLRVPASLLDKELAKRSGEQTIILTAEEAANDYSTKLSNLLKDVVVLGKPLEFNVLINNGGKTLEINEFDQYIEHTLQIPADKMDPSELVGLTYDPVSQTYVPVPAKFVFKDGVLTASLFRKGNSVYTVVKNKVTFSDLPATVEYKESIQKLANGMVFSGFGNGTFGPDQTVTRAQFAKMLNRALGILPKETSSSRFKDVKSGDWYVGDVEAAVDAGLFKGYEDGTFRPNNTITHAQMLVMLKNALNYLGVDGGTKSIPDSLDKIISKLPEWEKENYIQAYRNGILRESDVNLFTYKSNKATARKDSALLLDRLIGGW